MTFDTWNATQGIGLNRIYVYQDNITLFYMDSEWL